jgi:ectoine hydroxylase-related dioxygenase (phytanoyl-CoA dioxygenase family)
VVSIRAVEYLDPSAPFLWVLWEKLAAVDTSQPVRQLAEAGFTVLPDVLDAKQSVDARERLLAAARESERRGMPTYIPGLDPNPCNVRVFNLLDLDRVFRDLIVHPVALAMVRAVIGEHFLISNFTANIAKPGSQPMALHADQAIVIPPPWLEPWAINIIWCLDDVYAENGATRYLPLSHRIETLNDVPQDASDRLLPFDAKAGSVIVMDGRLWHTSGANTTTTAERALLFGYYTADFIRPQTNWNATLSDATKAEIAPPLFDWLGLGPTANTRHAAGLVAQLTDDTGG